MFLLKAGHFTMDNASNNAMMMESLKTKLSECEIDFNLKNHRIMCFVHIVDLCSGQVISGIAGGDEDNLSDDDTAATAALNLIALAHMAVWAIQGLGVRWDAFDEVIVSGNAKGWFRQGSQTIKVK